MGSRLAVSLFASGLFLAGLLASRPAASELHDGPGPAPSSYTHLAWEHWDPHGLDAARFPLQVVFVGAPPDSLSEAEVVAALSASIEAWNDVACSYAALHYAGRRERLDTIGEGEISVFFADASLWSSWPKPPIASAHLGTHIALNGETFDWQSSPQPYYKFHERDAGLKSRIDLQSALTHELGHVLGLEHTLDDNTATMVASYLRDGGQSRLAADDKFGLCHLYPSTPSIDECQRDAQCGDGGRCVSDETFRVCQKPQGRVGDHCALDLLHCPGTCLMSSSATGTGYCTTPCSEQSQCPSYFGCEVAGEKSLCKLTGVGFEQPSRGCAVAVARPASLSLGGGVLALGLAAALLVVRRRRRLNW
ncbi:MAG: matrixin family metalloprotease [Bradymonadaceae bacterium]|nr:matrixin family metalloprotease [Lujinxingiaceae bacterium]